MHRKNRPAFDDAVSPAEGVTSRGQPLSYNRAPVAELAPWIARLYVTKVSVPADYVLSCGLFNDWACLRVQLAGEWTAQTADGPRAHDRAALLFGPQSRIMPVTVKGSFISLGASYRPGALQAMNGIKVGDYLDRLENVCTITGEGDALLDSFDPQDSPENWLRILEGRLLRLIERRRCARPDPVSAHFENIILRDPAMTVSDAARECGVERRRLERLCHRDFGMAPKQVMRRARAIDMASLLRGVAEPEEGDQLALRYYDESHLSREFTEFFGMPPRQFMATPQPILTLALESRQAYRLEALRRLEPGASRPWQ